MPLVDAPAALVQLVADVLVLAHDLGYPHEEAPKQGGGSASVIVIVAAVVATLALAGALFWVRERMRRAEEAEAADSPDAAPG